jgi:hypothetical protein
VNDALKNDTLLYCTCEDKDFERLQGEPSRKECNGKAEARRFLPEDFAWSTLLQPSATIQRRVDAVTKQFAGFTMVAMAIRTTWDVKTAGVIPHLEHGDEDRFIACWHAAVRFKTTALPPLKLFLATDSNEVAAKVERSIGAEHVVWSRGDVSHTFAEGDVSTASSEGVYKAMADFFILGEAKIAFLTSQSLFADTATERKGAHATVPRRYVINSSGCGPDASKQRWCAKPAYRPTSRVSKRNVLLGCDALIKSVDSHWTDPFVGAEKQAGMK